MKPAEPGFVGGSAVNIKSDITAALVALLEPLPQDIFIQWSYVSQCWGVGPGQQP